jgi:hypothetical protein
VDLLHDYWFHALGTPDGHMTGDERELMQLAEQIREWRRPIGEIAAHVVGTGEGWLTELSTSELKELFALRAEAVQE